METQLTVRLPDDLRKALDELSRRTHRKSSEIVRAALRSYLDAQVPEGRPAERVRRLLGSLDSGVPDLAENHRDHIIASIRRGR